MAKTGIPLASDLGALVAETLDAVTLADGLSQRKEHLSMARPSFAELYRYATNPHHRPSEGLLAGLAGDEKLQADFNALVDNLSTLQFPMVAAASSGDVEHREIPGARLTFKTSKADAAQLYVILELDDPAKAPGMMFVRDPSGSLERVVLPEADDGRTQLLIDASSDLAKGLRDIHTEILLR